MTYLDNKSTKNMRKLPLLFWSKKTKLRTVWQWCQWQKSQLSQEKIGNLKSGWAIFIQISEIFIQILENVTNSILF